MNKIRRTNRSNDRFDRWEINRVNFIQDWESFRVPRSVTNRSYVIIHRCFVNLGRFTTVSCTKGANETRTVNRTKENELLADQPLRHNSRPDAIYLCIYVYMRIYIYIHMYRKRDYFLCSAIAIYIACVNRLVCAPKAVRF